MGGSRQLTCPREDEVGDFHVRFHIGQDLLARLGLFAQDLGQQVFSLGHPSIFVNVIVESCSSVLPKVKKGR